MRFERILLTFAVLGFVSCTVIEDRSICPCWLKVTYDDCESMSGDIRYYIWNADTLISKGVEDISAGYHIYDSPRGHITYSASFGIPDDCIEVDTYQIPEGMESAEFYAFKEADIAMVADYSEVAVKPGKQFSNILIKFEEDITERYQDMSCEVTSSTGGIDLMTLEPSEGLFKLMRYPSRDGQFFFRIPRQGFGDLSLTVIESGERLNVYSLSNILDKNGYDWTASSLKDATISLSLVRQDVSVELGDWELGGDYSAGL